MGFMFMYFVMTFFSSILEGVNSSSVYVAVYVAMDISDQPTIYLDLSLCAHLLLFLIFV
jgi:hypothetical protein